MEGEKESDCGSAIVCVHVGLTSFLAVFAMSGVLKVMNDSLHAEQRDDK